MRDYPKSIKKGMRQWAATAYERELHRELEQLDDNFAQWRAGEINSWELSDLIHVFYTGPSRDLYNRYNSGQEDVIVALAIAEGILSREEVPGEVFKVIESWVEHFTPPR